MNNLYIRRFLKITALLLCLYAFLVSIGLLGATVKGFGKEFAENLIRTTSNPAVGLFIGLLTTSIIQSSSTTTSIVVGLVGSGVLTVNNAIFIVMGANFGTGITSKIVSFGHITRKEEFRRAFGGATLHDTFHIIAILILFPLELATGYLRKTATLLVGFFKDTGAIEISSPVKIIIRPAVDGFQAIFTKILALSPKASSICLVTISFILLFCSLYFLVKLTKSIVIKRSEIIFDKIIGKSGPIAILLGCFFTATIQSSSITTSILVPLQAAGVLSLENNFSITMGACVGTTVTALLASLTGSPAGMIVAFAHMIFNITGIMIVYPFRSFRMIPVKVSSWLGDKSGERRGYALLYVLIMFFLIPAIFIFGIRFFK